MPGSHLVGLPDIDRGKRSLEPATALGHVATRGPIASERGRQTDGPFGLGVGCRGSGVGSYGLRACGPSSVVRRLSSGSKPFERGAEVVVLSIEDQHPFGLLRTAKLRLCPLGKSQIVGSMRTARWL